MPGSDFGIRYPLMRILPFCSVGSGLKPLFVATGAAAITVKHWLVNDNSMTAENNLVISLCIKSTLKYSEVKTIIE